jgi:glyoxylase I family protein
MRAGSVHHLAVVVAELARAEAFYAGVLGLPVQRRHDDAAGQPRAVWLDLDAHSFLALERAGAPDAAARADEAPGWHCVALRIARGEREAWRVRLAAAGHPVERETSFTLYARDPDGALVALSHWPEPA